MTVQERLLWLAGIPSRTGEEKALADAIATELAGLALPSAPRRYGDSLVVPLAEKAGGPAIVLVSHLDVAGRGPPAQPRVHEGRIYGAGVADVKCGLALVLDLAARPPAGVNLTAVIHARGEGGYHQNHLVHLLGADSAVRQAELAVILEPTDNTVQHGCAGSTHATFLFTGKSGHSGQPSQRNNAIHSAHNVLRILATTQPIPDELEGLTWYEHIEATSAQSGYPSEIVPAELWVDLHHTYGPRMTPHDSQERLMGLAYGSAKLRFEDLAPPAPPQRPHPLVRELEASGVRGVGPRLTWTDAGAFAEAGIPAVNFGPGTEAQSHQADEWTDAAALDEGRAVLERWFARLAPAAAAPRAAETPPPRAAAKSKTAKSAPRSAKSVAPAEKKPAPKGKAVRRGRAR